jgi:uncharacterized membrane protein
MASTCANCGLETPEMSGSCRACGEVQSGELTRATLPERFAAAFAYFSLIPAIVLILVGRFKNSAFVGFHCFQSIFVSVAALVIGAVLGLCITFGLIPALFSALVLSIVSLACFLVWLVLVVKALQGRRFRLPWIGALAEKKASR